MTRTFLSRQRAGFTGIRRAVFVLAIACTALSSAARADLVWNFSFSGGPFPDYGPYYDQYDNISGQLTTTDLNAQTDTYTITGISGTDDGNTITGLDPAGNYTDNLLYASAPYLDFDGFSFKTSAGDDANLYYNYNGHYWDWLDYGATIIENGTFTVTQASDAAAAPEPGTFALLGAGLVAAGVARRRRNDKGGSAVR